MNPRIESRSSEFREESGVLAVVANMFLGMRGKIAFAAMAALAVISCGKNSEEKPEQPTTSITTDSNGCLPQWYYSNEGVVSGPYNGCADVDNNGKPWCATQATYVQGKQYGTDWKYCADGAKEGEIDQGCVASPWVYSDENWRVTGPFKGCSRVGDPNDKLWCPTKISYISGEKLATQWKECKTPDQQLQKSEPVEQVKNEPKSIVVKDYSAQPYTDQSANKLAGDVATIYFPTDGDKLDRADAADVCKFLDEHSSKLKRLLVEGYADERGTDEHNNALSARRAAAVEARIGECAVLHGVKVPQVITTSFGESRSVDRRSDPLAYAKNRRVSIIANLDAITRGLNLLKGDIILIDDSGSMGDPLAGAGKSKWDVVKGYSFPSNAKKFVFNGCFLKPAPTFDNIGPGCTTPLWNSLETMINQAEKGQKITVVSDGEDSDVNSVPTEYSVNVRRSGDIIRQAREKGVPISFVSVGVEEQTARLLAQIARETRGKIYVLR